MVLVDTNVLMDVLQDDPVWARWSQRQLDIAAARGRLVINPVVYAELSIAFERIEELEDVMEATGLLLEELPREALFLAGKVSLGYRRRRGSNKQGILPDFFIGAHAAVRGVPLLTRDARRYSAYFPTVEVIGPR